MHIGLADQHGCPQIDHQTTQRLLHNVDQVSTLGDATSLPFWLAFRGDVGLLAFLGDVGLLQVDFAAFFGEPTVILGPAGRAAALWWPSILWSGALWASRSAAGHSGRLVMPSIQDMSSAPRWLRWWVVLWPRPCGTCLSLAMKAIAYGTGVI